MIFRQTLFSSSCFIQVFFQNLRKMHQSHILKLAFDRGMRFNHDVVLSEFCRGAQIGVNSASSFQT